MGGRGVLVLAGQPTSAVRAVGTSPARQQTAESYADGSHMAVSPFLRTLVSRPRILVLDCTGAPYRRPSAARSIVCFLLIPSPGFRPSFSSSHHAHTFPQTDTRASAHISPSCSPLFAPPPLHPIWGARRLRTGTALRRDPDQLCWLVSRAHLDTTERLTPIKTGQRPRAASPQNLTSSSARRHERPRKGGPDSTTDRGVVGSMLARVSSICRDKFTVLKFAHLVPEQPPRMSHG